MDLKDFYKQVEDQYNAAPPEKREDVVKQYVKELDAVKSKIKKLGGCNLIIKFGKFKGSAVKDIPAWYLLWCFEQDWFAEHNGELYSYIKTNLKKLKKQKKEDLEEDRNSSDLVEILHEDWGDRDPGY